MEREGINYLKTISLAVRPAAVPSLSGEPVLDAQRSLGRRAAGALASQTRVRCTELAQHWGAGERGNKVPPHTHTQRCPRNTDPRDLVTALHDGSARRWGVAGDFRGSASSRVPLPGQGPRITEPGKGPSRRLDTQALKADLMAGMGHLFHPSPSGSWALFPPRSPPPSAGGRAARSVLLDLPSWCPAAALHAESSFPSALLPRASRLRGLLAGWAEWGGGLLGLAAGSDFIYEDTAPSSGRPALVRQGPQPLPAARAGLHSRLGEALPHPCLLSERIPG